MNVSLPGARMLPSSMSPEADWQPSLTTSPDQEHAQGLTMQEFRPTLLLVQELSC